MMMDIYEFKCFPHSRNLTINHQIIGDFKISQEADIIKIVLEDYFYEVLSIEKLKLKLSQNNLIFEIIKKNKSH